MSWPIAFIAGIAWAAFCALFLDFSGWGVENYIHYGLSSICGIKLGADCASRNKVRS